LFSSHLGCENLVLATWYFWQFYLAWQLIFELGLYIYEVKSALQCDIFKHSVFVDWRLPWLLLS